MPNFLTTGHGRHRHDACLHSTVVVASVWPPGLPRLLWIMPPVPVLRLSLCFLFLILSLVSLLSLSLALSLFLFFAHFASLLFPLRFRYFVRVWYACVVLVRAISSRDLRFDDTALYCI